jgi:hypothetical protein
VRRLALDQMAGCLADDYPSINAALGLGLQHLGTGPRALAVMDCAAASEFANSFV